MATPPRRRESLPPTEQQVAMMQLEEFRKLNVTLSQIALRLDHINGGIQALAQKSH